MFDFHLSLFISKIYKVIFKFLIKSREIGCLKSESEGGGFVNPPNFFQNLLISKFFSSFDSKFLKPVLPVTTAKLVIQ